MKAFLSILLLFFSFSSLAQKASGSAQQVVTIRLMNISILEKLPASANSLQGTPIQIHSSQNWVIHTSDIKDWELKASIKNTIEVERSSSDAGEFFTKVVTLTNI